MMQVLNSVENWRTQHYHRMANLADELTIPSTGFNGRTVYNGQDMRAILMAFAPSLRLSEQSTPNPVHFHIFEGEVEVMVGQDILQLEAGHWVDVPSQHSHSIYVKRPCKLLMLLQK